MAIATGVLSSGQVTQITTSLTEFGNTLLDSFVQLLPALCVICAIWFVYKIIASKVF